ncbi:MAG: CDP-alcohol phosphatidyltransferase [Rhodospirillales bacterium RIFCSPLOWO2_12_FULL_58_28]|nr:MAG: CDP-alcohol phosphatidyltransferase [Rhodospirillales bacterium RIFCSPLOWO2_02_FULL_58_16]OHC78697.1 MAG: CDP-alcohol phosphatidyltransferase [Rhodospirillales bacterium RIFCSPLOWO2_12_FULL_58_28]
MNIPNLISIGRLLCVPVLVWLVLDDQIIAAFWLFIIAAVSDAVDGFIAKRFNAETTLGKFLDPLADKALLVCAYVTLGNIGLIEIWLVIMVVFRDALIVGGAILYETLTHSLIMEPLMISKINTVAQIVLVAAVLGVDAYGVNDGVIIDLMAIVVAATTLLSGAVYIMTWGRRVAAMEEKN